MRLEMMGGRWNKLKEVIEGGEEEKIDIDNGGGDGVGWQRRRRIEYDIVMVKNKINSEGGSGYDFWMKWKLKMGEFSDEQDILIRELKKIN